MDNYAPLVRCYTVILVLIMTCIFGLNTHAVDFSNTFSQAEHKVPPVYMVCPPVVGMNSD